MLTSPLVSPLVCPQAHEPLQVASPEQVVQVNQGIEAGTLTTPSGAVVRDPIESGWINSAGTRLYPVRDGLPILLVSESIEVLLSE